MGVPRPTYLMRGQELLISVAALTEDNWVEGSSLDVRSGVVAEAPVDGMGLDVEEGESGRGGSDDRDGVVDDVGDNVKSALKSENSNIGISILGLGVASSVVSATGCATKSNIIEDRLNGRMSTAESCSLGANSRRVSSETVTAS